jgi:hypothetical protein
VVTVPLHIGCADGLQRWTFRRRRWVDATRRGSVIDLTGRREKGVI